MSREEGWGILGDFNAVYSQDKRVRLLDSFDAFEALEFSPFYSDSITDGFLMLVWVSWWKFAGIHPWCLDLRLGYLVRNLLSLISQKSRVKWTKEGDANNVHIHACLTQRRNRKREDSWLKEVLDIKTIVQKHFSNHFRELVPVRSTLMGVF
ncbi:hypothetical protein RIF29_39634 [Crotalaria pallida]|uniref:Uncharacterized protein n=1 Tax=Crotalaria pallida TaxID=3830 RepID=A0AAN9E7W6_CROPI